MKLLIYRPNCHQESSTRSASHSYEQSVAPTIKASRARSNFLEDQGDPTIPAGTSTGVGTGDCKQYASWPVDRPVVLDGVAGNGVLYCNLTTDQTRVLGGEAVVGGGEHGLLGVDDVREQQADPQRLLPRRVLGGGDAQVCSTAPTGVALLTMTSSESAGWSSTVVADGQEEAAMVNARP